MKLPPAPKAVAWMDPEGGIYPMPPPHTMLHTEDQLRDYGLACARAALEAAAGVCDGLEREKWEQIHRALAAGGVMRNVGPLECRAAIRALEIET